MGEFLGFMALSMTAMAAAEYVRSRRAKQRASRLEEEGRTDLTVRVRGTAEPYPQKWRAGRLRISGRSAVWHPRRGTPLAIHGLQVVRTRLAGPDDRVEGRFSSFSAIDFVILLARDSRGAVVELAVAETDAPLLDGYLRGDVALPEAPVEVAAADPDSHASRGPLVRLKRHLPIWAIVVGAVGLLWMLAWGVLLIGGSSVDAAVLANDEDLCTVEWADPWDGRPQQAEVDCYGEVPGEVVRVRAVGWPARGEAVDQTSTSIAVPGVTVVLLGVAAFGFVSRRRERRSLGESGVSDLPVGPVLQNHVAAPVLDAADDITYSRMAEVMTARSQAEAWATRHAPEEEKTQLEWPDAARRWWSVPALRRLARSGLLTAVAALGGVALFAALFGYRWWATSVHLATGSTATAVATVDDVYDGEDIPFLPDDVYVVFEDADAETATATVPGFDVEPGDTVRVEYDVHDPGHARIVEGGRDGLARGVWITGLMAAGGLGFAGWRLLRSVRLARRVWRVKDLPPQSARYVLLPTTDGGAGLALFPPAGDVPPTVLVPLADDVLGLIPVAGGGLVHGEPAPDATLVVETAGLVLWPGGPAQEADADLVLDTVNGVLIGDDEPD